MADKKRKMDFVVKCIITKLIMVQIKCLSYLTMYTIFLANDERAPKICSSSELVCPNYRKERGEGKGAPLVVS